MNKQRKFDRKILIGKYVSAKKSLLLDNNYGDGDDDVAPVQHCIPSPAICSLTSVSSLQSFHLTIQADATNLEDYIAYVWAPAKAGSEGAFHTEFDESVFLPPSNYMLVYFSSGARDIYGVSQPFSIR